MATLHNLLSNYRDQSVRNRENVHEWKVDGFLVDWECLGHPLGVGVMFDYNCEAQGAFVSNNIAREGPAVFWPVVWRLDTAWQRYTTHPDEDNTTWAQRAAVLTVLHEFGHAFGCFHQWSNCHIYENGKLKYYDECDDGTIMSKTYHYDELGGMARYNAMRYNMEDPTSANGFKNFNVTRWYRLGPEAWVKPGRYNPDLGFNLWIAPYRTY